jgi:hypothetical protein
MSGEFHFSLYQSNILVTWYCVLISKGNDILLRMGQIVPSRVMKRNEDIAVRMVHSLRRVIYILGGVADLVTSSSSSALVGQLFQI